MSFCTVVNCMDGRVQIPVIRYLRERVGVSHVDVITEAGPVAVLVGGDDGPEVRSIRRRVDLSREAHGSTALAIVAHPDCAGNPVPDEEQMEQLVRAARNLAIWYPGDEIIALWVDRDGEVHETAGAGPRRVP